MTEPVRAEPRRGPDPSELAAGFSAILAELAHAPEAEVGRWAPALREGDTLGRFVLRREVGRGGMGVVWEAEDPALARRVALKLVRTGTRASARGDDWLKREAEAVARLGHPAIVTLHDYGNSPAGPYLVFERLHGRGLDRALLDGPLPYPRVLELAVAVAGALDHAHRAGVIHRDLKPGNVFLLEGGGVKVLDFGLASLLGVSGLGDAGTPAFMAPEQWRGDLGDARTDLFALGVTLWNALTGRLPYPVVDEQSAAAAPGETPRLPREAAPASFRALVERCLDRLPERRPASAGEVLEALQANPGRARRSAPASAPPPPCSWRPWPASPPPAGSGGARSRPRETGSSAWWRRRATRPAIRPSTPSPASSPPPSSSRAASPSSPALALRRSPGRRSSSSRTGSTLSAPGRWPASATPGCSSSQRRAAPARRLVVTVRAVDPEDEHLLFERSTSLASPGELARRGGRALGGPAQEAPRAARRPRRRPDPARQRRLAQPRSGAGLLPRGSTAGRGRRSRTQNPVLACPPYFQAALAADPGFALAHHWLARTAFVTGTPPDEARPHVAVAMAAVDRLPAREALLVRSWSAHVEGRQAEAEALADEAVARFPDDLEALDQAAALRRAREDLAGTIPFVERLVALEPETGESQVDLVELLRALDRREELARLVARLEERTASPAVDRAVVRGYLGLGRPEDAVGRARARFEQLGNGVARRLLFGAYEDAGRYAEAEPLLRAMVDDHPDRPHYRFGLVNNLAAQGRLREALRELDEAESRAKGFGPGFADYLRSVLLTLGKDEAALWRAASRAVAADPLLDSTVAIALALRGDLAHAERLAPTLAAGTVRAQYEAVRAWRTGDSAEALGALQRQLETGSEPPGAFHPSYLVAEVSLASGNPAGALAAVDRYRRSKVEGYWRNVTTSRSGLLAARAHLALGHQEEARRELDRLLDGLRRADPDLPVLLEGRALRKTLGR